tara:strand:+ start:3161 stop:3556 length:396 start_codon:yes stop_codon:yes gene_type:complete
MELLDQYIDELTQDTHLDEFNVRDMQLKLPGIKHKWAGRQVRAKIELGNLKSKRWKIVNTLIDRLVEESPIAITRPSAQQKVIKHEVVLKLDSQIQEFDYIISFLEKTDRTLSSMTFDIRNLTEIMKLETQ